MLFNRIILFNKIKSKELKEVITKTYVGSINFRRDCLFVMEISVTFPVKKKMRFFGCILSWFFGWCIQWYFKKENAVDSEEGASVMHLAVE